MISATVFLLVWALTMFIISIVMFRYAQQYFLRARIYEQMQKDLAKKAEDHVKQVELETKMQHNKIATSTVDQFFQYLSDQFAKILEIEARKYISNKDYGGAEKLYAHALTSFVAYLGADTVKAIDYYYGEGFLENWASYSYQLMESRGYISRIINDSVGYETYEKSMM